VIFRFIFIAIAASCATLFTGCQDKEKEARRAQLREIMHGNTPDADVAAAMVKAKETVGEFLTAMQKPGANPQDFVVRKAFPAEGGKQQILWISGLTYDGKLLRGRIDDNTVQKGSGVPRDGMVSFPPSEVADWMYKEGHKTVGGWMLRVLKTKFPEEWKAQRYDDRIDFKE
jgi:uncharacterized protein YegJ (DUF2314 family)